MRFILNLLFVITLCPLVQAQSLKLAVVEFPPLGIHKDGKNSGVGVEVSREMAKRAKVSLVEFFTATSKFASLSDSKDIIFPVISRNSDREAKFKWIGKVFEDRYCFARKVGDEPITDIEKAKKLSKIAVNEGGATETFLKKLDFKNLDQSVNNQGSVRKLLAGRVDAWFSSELSVTQSLKENQTDPKQVVCSGEFAKPTFWIATFLNVPEENVKALKAAFEALEAEGFIKKELAKYQ